jgi:diaminopimelate decarboxylase
MLSYQDNILHIEGKSLQKLAEEIETPFFLLSESRIRGNYYALESGLSSSDVRIIIRYCAKTNNEAGVLRLLSDCGSDIMVSHLAEAQLALQCGYSPEKIAFQRPVLNEEEVRSVLALGVTFFHAYSMRHLDILKRIANESDVEVRISLRLRNDAPASRFSPIGFLSRRLGFKSSEIFPAVAFILESSGLHLRALNFYRGTQQGKPQRYQYLLQKSANLASRIHSQYGIAVEEINLGGGIPSPSIRGVVKRLLWRGRTDLWTSTNSTKTLENYARRLSKQFFQEIHSIGLPKPPILALEPGRSIVGNAGILITRVRYVQGKWVFLDASRNFLGENPLFFTRHILPVDMRGRNSLRYYHLSGSTLNTTDVIDLWRRLPFLSSMDALAFCDTGAYSISRSSRYAGMAPAIYLLNSDGSLRMIRHPEESTDLMSPMIFKDGVLRSSNRKQ